MTAPYPTDRIPASPYSGMHDHGDRKMSDAASDLAALRAFAQAVMAEWPDSNEYEGIQELAAKHGLLVPVMMAAPCGPDCACEEYHGEFPVECYRKTDRLLGTKSEQDK
jgi:hypothetical protein